MLKLLPTYRALEGYDIEKLFVKVDGSRGLKESDFIVPVKVMSVQELADLMLTQDVIMSF
jgi:tRNA 2-thiouridine synthesizing protein C